MKTRVITYLFPLLTLVACKKDKVNPCCDPTNPNCPNYDPCVLEVVKAQFVMGEYFGTEISETDSVHFYYSYPFSDRDAPYITDQEVVFSSKALNATHVEWYIGNEVNPRTQSEFSILFPDTIGKIRVRLIAHGFETNCINSNIDTLDKYLNLVHHRPSSILGRYTGYNTDEPGNQFQIQIDTFADPYMGIDTSKFYDMRYGIQNLPNGFSRWTRISSISTKSFFGTTGGFQLGDSLNFPQDAKGVIDDQGQIRITYLYRKKDPSTGATIVEKNRTFVGEKN